MRWDRDKRTYWYTEPDGRGGNIRKLYKEVGLNPIVSGLVGYSRQGRPLHVFDPDERR